jgi:GTP cyclohydrolase II
VVAPLVAPRVTEDAAGYLRTLLSSTEAPETGITVTLAWAQSLDGAIARERGKPSSISGDQSVVLTHLLRSLHDLILVGIGTILSDDPRLTTRRVDGADPRVVVLDSSLRCPPDARIFSEARRTGRPGPLVVTTDGALDGKATAVAAIRKAGGEVLALPRGTDPDAPERGASRASLAHLPAALAGAGYRRLMVEGGGEVIAAFLSARLGDLLAVTIAPRVTGGYRLPVGLEGWADDTGEPEVRWFAAGVDGLLVLRRRGR